MGIEEFKWQIERSEKLEKSYRYKYKVFGQLLTRNLLSVVFKYHPKAKKRHKEILNLSRAYISEVCDVFDFIYTSQHNGIQVADLPVIQKPKARDLAQQELDQCLSELKVDADIFSSIFWELYREEYLQEEYHYAIYMVMKRSFTSCYFVDIMAWDSEGLRFFDRAVYRRCAASFQQATYKVLQGKG